MNSISFRTEQEAFWAGEFGNDYIRRNNGAELVAANLALFSEIIQRTRSIASVIEFGANIGLNLRALRQLLPNSELSAIEINAAAAEALRVTGDTRVYQQSILDFQPDFQRDLVLIKGVLIHIAPEVLTDVYDRLHASSRRYICLVEYYNPTPTEVRYRGHEARLFKRDFAGEMLDRFPDLHLIGYGFKYHRDPAFPGGHGDDSWFLLEKSEPMIPPTAIPVPQPL